MDGAQVGVLEQADQVGFGSLLQGEHCGRLEAEVRLEVLCDFTNEALKFTELGGEKLLNCFYLERQLPEQEFSGLLVTTNLAQSHGAGTVAVRLLDSASGRCGLAGCLKFDRIILLV